MEYLSLPVFDKPPDSSINSNSVQRELGEHTSLVTDKVAVYSGDEKTPVHQRGTLYITSHQLYYLPEGKDGPPPFRILLCNVCSLESTPATFTQSAKIKLNFVPEASMLPTLPICPTCTFNNHALLRACEMCETILPSAPFPSPPPYLRLSFRGGGHSSALSALKQAIDQAAWKEKPRHIEAPISNANFKKNQTTLGGIGGLEEQLKLAASLTSQQLDDAFNDLQTLMDRAQPMVQLAGNIAAKLQRSNPSTEDLQVQGFLLQLGIDSPISKDAAGSLFHLELAKELGKVLLPILNRSPYLGVMDVMDAFCLFNRARGVGNMISPGDLMKCCQHFEATDIPLSLRRFPSGVAVLQTKFFDGLMTNELIVSKLQEKFAADGKGLDLMGLANKFQGNIPLELLRFHVDQAEQTGLVCKDLAPPLNIVIYYPASPFLV